MTPLGSRPLNRIRQLVHVGNPSRSETISHSFLDTLAEKQLAAMPVAIYSWFLLHSLFGGVWHSTDPSDVVLVVAFHDALGSGSRAVFRMLAKPEPVRHVLRTTSSLIRHPDEVFSVWACTTLPAKK